MSEPRYRRRKEDRPQEITEAALAAFAEKGYAATRVDEVAKRAGISKGLLYVYFKTKEELFKAVVRSVVIPRVKALEDALAESELSAEDFIRGPLLAFLQKIPGSPVGIVVRLLIAEAPRHPDLVEFYYRNVISRAIKALKSLIQRGVDNGEFRPTALSEFPQLLVAPVMFSVIWRLVFGERTLDTDRLIASHIDIMLAHLKAKGITQ